MTKSKKTHGSYLENCSRQAVPLESAVGITEYSKFALRAKYLVSAMDMETRVSLAIIVLHY